MNETPAPFSVSAIEQLRAAGLGGSQVAPARRRARRRRCRRSAPTAQPNAATLRLEVAEVADLGDPGVGLELVVVDDRRDLAEAAVARAGCSDSQNWPSWSSPSPVSTHTRPRRPGEPVGAARTPCAFEMPIPSEPVLVCTCGRARARPGGPAARRAGAAGGAGRTSSAPEPDQHRVQRRARRGPSTRSSGRPRRAPRGGATTRTSMQREARAEVARAGARDHVERVDPAGVGERGARARRRRRRARGSARARRAGT